MDKELDEKLEDTLINYHGDPDFLEANIEQIKAAFKEAGYIKPDFAPYYVSMIEAYLNAGGRADCVLMSRNDFVVNSKLAGWAPKDKSWQRDVTGEHPEDTVMTGQEWLDRFTKELNKQFEGAYSLDVATAIEAAKRAAGVADE